MGGETAICQRGKAAMPTLRSLRLLRLAPIYIGGLEAGEASAPRRSFLRARHLDRASSRLSYCPPNTFPDMIEQLGAEVWIDTTSKRRPLRTLLWRIGPVPPSRPKITRALQLP
jgi:hypothetical protein